MMCPHCSRDIPEAELRRHLNTLAAKQPRPGLKGKPSHNPAGRPRKQSAKEQSR